MTGVVYDRQYDDGTLTFEASGALKNAALVMRDRETDSWWSVMAGEAIDGEMTGEPLQETGLAVKTTWGEWKASHPDTRVLSLDGVEHESENAYQAYFDDEDRTYREATAKDNRLPEKTPVFAFRWKDQPYVVTHENLNGGIIWRPEGEGDDKPVVLFHRLADAPTPVSTRAAVLPHDIARMDDPEGLAKNLDAHLESQTPGVTRLPGFDTYWYTWAAQNPGSIIID
jgi:hypothetical protein